MKYLLIFFVLIISLLLFSCQNESEILSPPQVAENVELNKTPNFTKAYNDSDWELKWSDEFNGTSLNTSIWGYEIGYIRNNELQYYTNRTQNVRLNGGNLELVALKENYNGYQYTSGSINTKGKKSFQYGKIEARMKLPAGKGIWPAFWGMGISGGWPASGEIDVMENINGESKVYGTAHWDDGGHKSSGGFQTGVGTTSWHIYSVIWDNSKIEWYVDGVKYFTADITGAVKSELRQPFYLLLNLAVGGNWPGPPDNTTQFPSTIFVDWVRVYQKTSSPPTNNLLINPGFETGSFSPWLNGNAAVSVQQSQKHTGSFAVKAYSRVAEWSGPRQNIKNILLANGTGSYTLEAYYKGISTGGTANVFLKLKYGGKWYTYMYKTVSFTNSSWTKISVTGNVSWSGTLEDAQVNIATKGTTYPDFYADDILFVKN